MALFKYRFVFFYLFFILRNLLWQVFACMVCQCDVRHTV